MRAKQRLPVSRGSFDPLTLGQLLMIEPGINPEKKYPVPPPVYHRLLK